MDPVEVVVLVFGWFAVGLLVAPVVGRILGFTSERSSVTVKSNQNDKAAADGTDRGVVTQKKVLATADYKEAKRREGVRRIQADRRSAMR